jgi:hypothetical protein
MKNFFIKLNGWQRLFIVITLLIQLPITIYFITSHKENYILARNINEQFQKLNEQKSNPYEIRLSDLWDVPSTNYSSITVLNWDDSVLPNIENKKELELKVNEARKEKYTDTQILNYIQKELKIDLTKAKDLGMYDDFILDKLIQETPNYFKFRIYVEKATHEYALGIEGNGTSEQLKKVYSDAIKIVDEYYKFNFFKNIFIVFSISILISIVILITGYSIGWVYKGFKK